jgi:hypothetical protein
VPNRQGRQFKTRGACGAKFVNYQVGQFKTRAPLRGGVPNRQGRQFKTRPPLRGGVVNSQVGQFKTRGACGAEFDNYQGRQFKSRAAAPRRECPTANDDSSKPDAVVGD